METQILQNQIPKRVTSARFIRADSEPNQNLNKYEVVTISPQEHRTGKRASPVPLRKEISLDSLKAGPLTQNKHDNINKFSSFALMGPTQHNTLNLCTTSLIQSSSKAPKVLVTPEIVRPFPKAAPRKIVRRGRQPGNTKILTMTPEKENCSSECLTETSTKEKSNPNNDKCNNDKRSKNKYKETQPNIINILIKRIPY